ncbi:hypothetical protein V8E55_007367 [Tylopilus felleus]
MARLSRFVHGTIHCCKTLFTGTKHHQPASFGPPSPPLPNTQHKLLDADVTRAVDLWNASAQQAALALAEDFAPYFQSGSATGPTGQEASAVQRVSDYVTLELVQSLETKPGEEIVALLWTAFEACLAFALYQAASLTEFERGPIDDVDQRLHAAKSRVIEGISDVLLVAGCTAPRSDVMSQLRSKFDGTHTSLFNADAKRLVEVLDDMAPSNFEVFIARPHDKFDSKTMQEADGNTAEGGLVLCTTSVGLRRELEVVLKAKVLLKSFLD